ncbi:UNVERIFIED_CONTAM: hypothetical protein PYX00_001570 [Menopon gallinae]|uniref:Laminin subunit alpha-1 n=1 Tax=Menopon gallinae TaxID=328185 RepID=A0AAW2IDH9_9NEOP
MRENDIPVQEECNCYGHSDTCEYSEEIDKQHLSIDINGQYLGGGVCLNCRHNTEGINCNRCQKGYYRPFGRPLNATDVCERCQCDVYYSTGNCAEGTGKCECRKEYQEPKCDSCSFGYFGYPDCKPCECFLNGTRGYHCEVKDGACPCKPNYFGKFCNSCAAGYYGFPNCLPCDCNSVGSLKDECSMETGECECKSNFGGRACDRCKPGYYNYPNCNFCSCDVRGTLEDVCNNRTGECLCKEGFGGERCDKCVPGYFGYPDCRPCNCSENGSAVKDCDVTGKCSCLYNFAGRVCDQCSPGFYQYPKCLPCDCDHHGSIGVSCDNDGKCKCKDNFATDKCNACKDGFYNFPACEDCNCDPAGIIAGFAGCGSVPPGELCQCKPRVQGRICNECRPLYWNLRPGNPEGCEDCDCHLPGVIGGITECDTQSGQCACKPGVEARRCDQCRDGYYGLDADDMFGCKDCGCDIGGSNSRYCEKITGQCSCHPRVTGRDCRQPIQAHYFPTLYSQLQFEAEDGYTPSGSPVRYDFSENVFPDYSWKGYAIFSRVQSEIIQEIFINKPSLYRMILRYVNPLNETVTGNIKIELDHAKESRQDFLVQLKPTNAPTLVTVAGPSGGIPSVLVMDPGQWLVSISTPKTIFLDYFVLLPAAFYEATVLQQRVESPCSVDNMNLCRHFSYPELNFDKVRAEEAYLPEDDQRTIMEIPREFYMDRNHLSHINSDNLPIVSTNQTLIRMDLGISKPGPYVLVVSYVTPVHEWKTSTIALDTAGSSLKNKGVVRLTPCPYFEICRQVSTDKLGRIALYNFDNEYVKLNLKANPEDDSVVAIHSVTAVPLEDWSLDYIRPKSVCIKKDDQCIQTTYPIAPDSTKIEFEQQLPDLTASQLPNEVFDNNTGLIYLSSTDAGMSVHGTVPTPGPYVFVVHYYQPSNPEFQTQVVIQQGQIYEAKLATPHCPGNAGCRAVITQPDGNSEFFLNDDFTLTFQKPENKSLWLDYVLAIPADRFTESVLEEEPLDQSSIFISQCANNNFDINVNTTGFCRDAVFSLTTNYYVGALKCECNYQGSLSFECEQFGGQCQCKENVIGRRCDMCKTGYFGFPNCRPCNCPSKALCHNETGECICPRRVTGEMCDQCEKNTYGYDPLIGCEECNCHPYGVQNYNLQCDLYNGMCQCKDNIRGRTCDRCKNGHYAFPDCLECVCDDRGTTQEICDQVTSNCHCKNNVYGLACDLCKEGTFHISAENPDGCTKCFCFGKTTRCSSSNLYRSQITSFEDYDYATVEATSAAVNIHMVSSEEPELDIKDKVVYFLLPKAYSGNKLTSYGGLLNYTMSFSSDPYGNSVPGADVILHGADMYLLYFSLYRPTDSLPFSGSLHILENNFQLTTGFRATREQLMQVLENLTAVYVRATFGEYRITPKLEQVSLDIATPNYYPDAEHALEVEQCQCPPNYQGLSCEECAPGFYRVQGGPYGGYCAPCQCNGHSDVCDPVTGKCLNCKHNTYGDYCESCSVGYHGNATNGSPFDCLICACPLPVPSNNFATSCEVSDDGERISCNCMPGYWGARCESCSAGYFGRPEVQGDTCKKCNCSGNINPDDPASCNSITGECMRCLNNTYGAACNLCAPGYHGDAVYLKDCRSCDCDKCGSISCESHTGQCICQDNVVGERCERCARDHYGFKNCQGCLPCECGIAAEGSDCHEDSGQCKCKSGTTGRTCDVCLPGFWNYTDEGCLPCECNIEYSVGLGCNVETGQCECLPGVIGDQCDQCPHRWVLIQDRGCFECNSCTHDLLDTTDYLKNLIDPVMAEFKAAAGGFFTTQRLRYINDTAVELLDDVTRLDPSSFNAKPVIRQLDSLESELRGIHGRAEFFRERGEASAKDGERVRVEAVDLEELVREAADKTGNAVLEIVNLAASLDSGSTQQIDSPIERGKDILTKIQSIALEPYLEKAEQELSNATRIRDKMSNFTVPVTKQAMELEKLRKKIEDFNEKMDDLQNNTAAAEEATKKAFMLNHMNKEAKLSSKVYTIRNMTKDADDILKEVEKLLKNSTVALQDAKDAAAELEKERKRGMEEKNRLNETLLRDAAELESLYEPVKNAQVHSEGLEEMAKKLDDKLKDTRKMSGQPVEAAKAFAGIADNITEAGENAEVARDLGGKALRTSDGLDNRTAESKQLSYDLLEEASQALNGIQSVLRPQLDKAKADVMDLEEKNKFAQDQDEMISQELKQISSESNLEPASNQAMDKSAAANNTAQKTLATIKPIVEKAPEEVKRVKQLPKDIGAISHDVVQAKNQLALVNSILPDVNILMNKVKDTQANLKDKTGDIDKQVERLKRQIAEARDLASRVKVGVNFEPNTFVEIKNPDDLAKQSLTTKISGYFKTDQPNGALVYVGNEMGTSRKLKRAQTDDFMSVEIENGHPAVVVDLGSGPQRINSDMNVTLGNWYQFVVERTGKHVKLTIVEESPDGKEIKHVNEEVIPGTASILNLDPEESKIFVGGHPENAKIQPAVKYSSFSGQIEDLQIGDTPISLWNFNDAENNKGALQRNKLVNLNPSTGYRFNGNGFAILDSRPYRMDIRSVVSLKFKTTAPDGLLFLVGRGKNFLSLELKDGKVVYQYNLGDGTAIFTTAETFNDNRWHVIEATRQDKEGVLKVDDVEKYKSASPGAGKILFISDHMFFGGYPGEHEFKTVTKTGFDGCIDDVLVDATSVDLSKHISAFGVTPGCPTQFHSIVAFKEGQSAYIKYANASADEQIDLGFRFRTTAKNGLMLMAATRDRSDPFSISLIDGELFVMSVGKILTSFGPRYDDGQWHALSVRHTKESLTLTVDDFDTFSLENAPTPPSFKYGNLYFGGVPPTYAITLGKTASTTPFVGCIGDATFNGHLINFANLTDFDGVLIGKCFANDSAPVVIPHGAPKIPTENDILTGKYPEPGKPGSTKDGKHTGKDGMGEKYPDGDHYPDRGMGGHYPDKDGAGGIHPDRGIDGKHPDRGGAGEIHPDRGHYPDRGMDGKQPGRGGTGEHYPGEPYPDGDHYPDRGMGGQYPDRGMYPDRGVDGKYPGRGDGGEMYPDREHYPDRGMDGKYPDRGAGEGHPDRGHYPDRGMYPGRGDGGEMYPDREHYPDRGTDGKYPDRGAGEMYPDRGHYPDRGMDGKYPDRGAGEMYPDREHYPDRGMDGKYPDRGAGEGHPDGGHYPDRGMDGKYPGRGGTGEHYPGEPYPDGDHYPDTGMGGHYPDRGMYPGRGDGGEMYPDREHYPDRGMDGKYPDRGTGEMYPDRGHYPDRGMDGKYPDRGAGEGHPDRGHYPDRGMYPGRGDGGEMYPDREHYPDRGTDGKYPDRGAGEMYPDREHYPDRGMGGRYPDRGEHYPGEPYPDREQYPDRGMGGMYPDRGTGESYPDREQYPDHGMGGKFPVRGGVGGEYPDRGTDEQYPDRGMGGGKYPDRGPGESYPDREHPDFGIGGRFPDRGMGEKYPDRGIGEQYPDRGMGERYPDAGGKDRESIGGAIPDRGIEEHPDRRGEKYPESGVPETDRDREDRTDTEGRKPKTDLETGLGEVPKEKDMHKPEKTTAKPPPAIVTPAPTPYGSCALPLNPASDPKASYLHNGYRFGTKNGSWVEYRTPPGRLKNRYEFTLEFKTYYAEGILFYVSDKRHVDFTALYIKDGRVFFGFDCGSGPALLATEDRYDDGQWHTVTFSRENTAGKLIIDKTTVVTGESVGGTKALNVILPIYVGGLDPEVADSARQRAQGVNQSFAGCVKNLQLTGATIGKPTFNRSVVPCSDHTEPGVFFSSSGGYIRAMDSFRVGTNIDIKMDIKPRFTSGVLLAVHGKKDYLVLQMVDGVIKFTVDNGKGPFTSAFKAKDEFFFCDGKWHSIHAVQAKNVVVLSVDSMSVDPGIGVPGSTITDTRNPLYLGGTGPKKIQRRGSITQHQYVGCMRNVLINDTPLKLTVQRAIGNVTVSACPTI